VTTNFKIGDRVYWNTPDGGRVLGRVIKHPTTPPATMGPVIAVRDDNQAETAWRWLLAEDLGHVSAVDRLGDVDDS
jgi:hypothetical protein